ncbi:MAG: hypothetical protein IJ583_09660, partial [Firmicutes bacterium]|nr:hypothetical protein [Bacillota bacterium]
ENEIDNKVREYVVGYVIDDYMKGLLDDLNQLFRDMNKLYEESNNRFRSAIDDRDKYKKNIEQHNRRKETIENIEDCTSKFMGTWKEIVENVNNADN